ncbi:hypothetical protein EV421DRAFT_1997547 [Armillaria borealis]|uniref:Aminoglycoside phosphotransferase domain-containing protein n=1 Tax=Armillaria borealis TaxID=47425 RepID=A0AA39J2P7_9AGAR|nr:hypothetical protein EV421DRAFT_1997547 [Armillaria borealis]
MLYVTENTTVPIPYIQDHWSEPDIPLGHGEPYHLAYLVMDYIPGKTLEAIWPDLDSNRKAHIAIQFRGYVEQLRSLPPPPHLVGQITAITGRRRYDPLISRSFFDSFQSEASLNDFFLDRFSRMMGHGSIRIWSADFRKRLRGDHRIVFTHADFVRRNIIIGANDDVVAILDWVMAAFMPDVVDHYNDDGWKEFVSQFLDTYPDELALQNEMRDHYGWDHGDYDDRSQSFDLFLANLTILVNTSLPQQIPPRDVYPVAVAHYGVKTMRVKYWSILIVTKSSQIIFTRERTIKAHPHQICSRTNYNVNTSQDVSDVLKSTAYLDMVKVELIPKDQLENVKRIIQEAPVTLGDTNWDCCYWVISASQRLRNEGYSVEAKLLTGLQRELDEAVREDA